MTITQTSLPQAYIVEPSVHVDERGWFYRYFCREEFSELGFVGEWVQLNHSYTAREATIRGLHYQLSPYGEIKLVKCISGRVFDVIVDLRKGSPTFLQWFGVELSAENKKMMYIPEGFAHGFQTLIGDCELIYHHSAFYSKNSEKGIRYDDPLIGIHWPLEAGIISVRDSQHSPLDDQFLGI
jgi:dTDP-4-dehydrorhamnose 3,5-epimerase